MVSKGGAALKTLQSLIRLVQFLAALLILGVFSYFIASLANNDIGKPRYVLAVEIIAAAAVLYTLFGVLLTCFLGGLTAFGILGVLLDLLFMGAFIAVAIMTRSGRRNCNGTVSTPLGTGTVRTDDTFDINNGFGYGSRFARTYRPNLRRACRLNRAVFIVSLILIGLFLLSAILQLLLVRHHKKEKRYGPSPANGYTEGSGKKPGLFARKRNTDTRDAELATPAVAVVEKPQHNMIRPSHETGYTGSTVASPDPYGVNNTTNNKYTTTGNAAVGANPGFSGPPPHGTGPLHNYATTGQTTY